MRVCTYCNYNDLCFSWFYWRTFQQLVCAAKMCMYAMEKPGFLACKMIYSELRWEPSYWSWLLEFTSSSPQPIVTCWPLGTVVGLIGYWLYILPAGSPGSYSLSHTGDVYLGLHSLNGEGLNIAPSLQPQVCTEDSCSVDLNAVDPATQNPWIPTLSLAPFDLDLSSDPVLTLPLTRSTPPLTQTRINWPYSALDSEQLMASLEE